MDPPSSVVQGGEGRGQWRRGRPAFGLRVRGPGRVEPAVRGGSGRGFPLAPPAESGVRDKREGGAQGDVKGAEDQMESFRSIRADIIMDQRGWIWTQKCWGAETPSLTAAGWAGVRGE